MAMAEWATGSHWVGGEVARALRDRCCCRSRSPSDCEKSQNRLWIGRPATKTLATKTLEQPTTTMTSVAVAAAAAAAAVAAI